jgi:hypothetical protein
MKVELTMPSGLHEITLKQYQEYVKQTEKFADNEEMMKLCAISCFCRVPLQYVRMMKKTDVDSIHNSIADFFKEKPSMQPIIEIGGKRFGFIPDLQNMSYGEYLDLNDNFKDWATFHNAMAVMYRPTKTIKRQTYEIENYEGSATYSEVMLHVTMDVVFGASLFFYHLGKDLLNALADYLEIESKKLTTLANQHNLGNDGEHISQSISSLREILQSLTTYRKSHYLNVSPI